MITTSPPRTIEWALTTTLVGRICLSAIFLFSGVGKVLAPAATIDAIASAGLPLPSLGYALAIVIELLGGAALLAGYKLRWTAGILAAFTLATALIFHSAFADPNQLTHFLKNIAITGGFLYVIASGNQGGR
jgi:putative oxidoreductase